jgi:alpha-tubulin suppressor-like RCC1 family protein
MLKRLISGLCLSLLAMSPAFAQTATVVPSFSSFSAFTADSALHLYYAGLVCNGVVGNGTAGCSAQTQTFAAWTFPCSSAAVGSNSAFCISGTSLKVTGQNSNGVLGRGNLTQLNTWTNVTVGTAGTPVKVVAGLQNTYVLKSDGSLFAAGYPSLGQLGISTAANGQTFVQSLTGVANVFVGENNVYALKTDGSLWAAGDNTNGTLGAGVTANWSNWILSMAAGAIKVSASSTHAVLLKNDGSVWMTGRSPAGQFGQGYLSNTRIDTWTKVVDNARDIATGIGSTFIIGKNNQLYVAGDNSFGILGAGPVSTVPSFTSVLSNVANMDSSRYSAIAIKGDGTVWGTGQNASGELGMGPASTQMSWQQVTTNLAKLVPTIPLASSAGLAIVGTSLSPAKVLFAVPPGTTPWYLK